MGTDPRVCAWAPTNANYVRSAIAVSNFIAFAGCTALNMHQKDTSFFNFNVLPVLINFMIIKEIGGLNTLFNNYKNTLFDYPRKIKPPHERDRFSNAAKGLVARVKEALTPPGVPEPARRLATPAISFLHP
jgi:hypothetical protein